MRYLIIAAAILFSINVSYCQKRNAIWCFGDSAGIDFNNLSNPVAFSTGTDGRGTSCSIADTNGNLLFYAATPNPVLFLTGYLKLGVVYNAQHVVMQNGDSIVGMAWYNEHIIVPKPGSTSEYYLFTAGVTSLLGLYYSVINLSQNGGLGAVTQKNVQLNLLQANDAMQAIQHGNGRDWWVIFTRANNPNNQFYFYLVNPTGVTLHHTQNIGGINTSNLGNLTFNIEGNKALYQTYTGLLEVMDFDRCTGYFSNANVIEQEVVMDPLKYYWGSAFSADASKIYVTTSDSSNFLFQYDLNATNVAASKDTLYSFTNVITEAGALRLAPDGKIYLSNAWNDGFTFNYPYPTDTASYNFINMNLSVINYPDSLGAACDFQPYSFYLGGKRTYWGLPNNPNYSLGRLMGSVCDTLTNLTSPLTPEGGIKAAPNPTSGDFTLQFNVMGIAGELEIYDVMGNLLLKEYIAPWSQFKKVGISIPKFREAEGIYVCKLRRGNVVETVKVVME